MNYVSYEQALKLKELRFNEECIKCYFPKFDTEGFDLVFANKSLHKDYLTIGENIINGTFTLALFAPYVSQAINWFRKEGIHGYIHHSVASNYARQCTFSVCIDGYETYYHRHILSNYELCEEALLEYLLNNSHQL